MTMSQDTIKSAQLPRTRRRQIQFNLLLIICYCLATLIQPTTSIFHPISYDIRARHTECIYSRFEAGEFATFEVFITEADEAGTPSAAIQIEGPVVGPKVGKFNEETGNYETNFNPNAEVIEGRSAPKRKANTVGAAMQDSIDNWPVFVQRHSKHFTEAGIIHHAFFIDYTHSGEHEDAVAARADLSRKKQEEMEERRRKNMEERERRRREEGGEYRGDENIDEEVYEESNTIQHIVPDYIEPYEWTKPIKAAGWYRLCAQAEHAITVEMDIRSSSALGGIDPETWHVYTHDEREMLDEEERILGLKNREPTAEEVEAKLVVEELEKALQNQVKDYDLESTRKLMNQVNRLVGEMQTKQQNVHKRMKGHESDARRNYRRIVRSGTVETLLYIAITLFQVYTVRNWLLSKNVLGVA